MGDNKKINVILIVSTVILLIFTIIAGGFYFGGLTKKKILIGDIEAFISKNTYINDGVLSGIGDPYVITENGKYYMVATSDKTAFKLFSSVNLVDWEYDSLIYTNVQENSWARTALWQPQIIKKDNKYYMYYSGQDKNNTLRIGVAVCDTINGIYKDVTDKPIFDFGYAVIDPNVYIDDDGSIYMYYSMDCSENKVDNINTSQIYIVKMDSMTSITAKEGKMLITPDQEWEKISGNAFRWNEGPDILKHNGKYYLFYSANYFDSRSYSIGYAVSDRPEGPFVKNKNPVLTSEYSEISGTGNNSFFKSIDGKELFTAYHMHIDPKAGFGSRFLAIDRCGFKEDGTFYINGPTRSPQPRPDAHSNIVKIETQITVSATSTMDGRKTNSLIDGQFSAYSWDESSEWAANASDKKAVVTFEFQNKTEISSLFIYPSGLDTRKVKSVRLQFDDGSVIDEVMIGKANGEASIINFDTKKVKWIKISAKEFGEAECFGFSEVLFYKNK